ncbi:MAG: hypothetical protein ACI9HK_004812, partial [Pirellulaceae bacterium]
RFQAIIVVDPSSRNHINLFPEMATWQRLVAQSS